MPQAVPKPRFDTPEEFAAWEAQQPEPWELHDGVPVAMSPERLGHTRIRYQAWAEPRRALREAGAGCEAVGDGLTVPGPGLRSFRPDAAVLCGSRPGDDDTVATGPVVFVEVPSPSTASTDHGIKLESYFALPSVQHYLVVGSLDRRVVHHACLPDGKLLTALAATGSLRLDPPGITVSVDAFYEGTDLATPGS